MTSPEDFAEQQAETRADERSGWHRNPPAEQFYGQRAQNRYERAIQGEQP